MTLGVRGLVHDRERQAVFLIRHTYVPGWQLPGGGVEPDETMGEALERELLEEGNIALTAPPELRSLHANRRSSRRDHVALYLITAFLPDGAEAARPGDRRGRLLPAGRLARDDDAGDAAPAGGGFPGKGAVALLVGAAQAAALKRSRSWGAA